MSTIFKGELIAYLKANTELNSRVQGRIYSRRIDLERGLPAIVVSKISEIPSHTHSDEDMRNTTMGFYIFAATDKEVEEIKQQVNVILDGERVETENIQATCFLSNDADFEDYESMELNEWAGVLEYEIQWSII